MKDELAAFEKLAQDALDLRCGSQEREVQDEMRQYDLLGGVVWLEVLSLP
jgi:hypothetical protein